MPHVAKSDLEAALLACRESFLSVGFFSLFVNFLMLVPAFYMLQVYDRVIGSGSESTLLMLTLILLLLLGTMGALEWVRSRIMVRISTRLDTLLGQRLYDASFRQALYSGGMNASAQPLSDLTGLRQFLTGNGLFAFFDAPWLPIYLAVMFVFHPWFGWFGVLCSAMLVALAWANERLTNGVLKEANKENLAATAFTNKNLRNAEVVESMGMLPQLRRRWQAKNDRVLALQGLASDRAGTVTALSKTFRLLVQSLILGLGAYLALEQEISPGLMIAGSILLGRALAPIDLMIGAWKGFSSARSQYERLNELLVKVAAEPERMSLPAPKGELSAETLMVTPPGAQQPVIRGLAFRVAAGEAVGLIGPSGAGKSTLARALLGIWPAAHGKVRLDGADIFSWKRAELGPYIGYLPQDIELFEGSVGENIARFGDLDPVAVVEAARLAGVHELILQLPQGYDTVIGASGGALSGGQRQRIGLARAVYGKPRLIVLDEPNSNLDDQGERALAAALRQLKEAGTTLFVISHRPSVLASVDKLMVLREGTLALFGPRDEVWAELQKAQQQAAAVQRSVAGNV
ncbi:type I secretion system permease/ATPase [Pseudomonas sp. MAP12]|uniref:Type I secretion system permease/ATPase n=1 Tax=Geopseudomonas aromaticivorans TaxID=2849492 RepID=A0ABS6MXQ6_9GAMM|nr:type I secretion system permease/ATPase [Pseudomonas aromaticivorans]MBV2133602.1 type I secretion system permease/ATPase [Pseudomonas aromaticivorans]